MTKVALITGGARGIGAALVAELSGTFDVAFTHRTTAPAPDVPGHPIKVDLTEADAPARVVADVIDRFGRLDVVVNNAGLVVETSPDEADLKAYQAIFAVNLFAPMALLAAALPHLHEGACVLNISSVNARLPAMSAPVYSASKAALDCWTRAMAKQLGPRGIRVNAIAPGATEIPEAPRPPELRALFEKDTALDSLATPEDIAKTASFLVSPAAKAITGEVLSVSAGFRL